MKQGEGARAADPRVIVSVLGLAQIFAWGSSFYLLTVLAQPIAVDTGWSLSWIMGGLSVGLLAAAGVSPMVGRLVQHHGGRPVMAASALLLGLGLGTVALAPNLPVYMIGWLVIGLGMGAGLYDAAFATLTGIFGDRSRQSITALTLFGGFASTVCWPLTAWLEHRFGWRLTCVVFAGAQTFLLLPLLYLLIPPAGDEGPRKSAQDRTSSAAPPWSTSLLLLGFVFTLTALTTAILSLHLVTLLQSTGMSLVGAVAAGTLIGPAQVVSRAAEMAVASRYHPLWSMLASAILMSAGVGLLWATPALAAVALATYGAGNGLASVTKGTVPLALFGSRGYGTLIGRLARPALAAQAVAPPLAAIVLDAAGAPVVLAGVWALTALTCVLVAALAFASRES